MTTNKTKRSRGRSEVESWKGVLDGLKSFSRALDEAQYLLQQTALPALNQLRAWLEARAFPLGQNALRVAADALASNSTMFAPKALRAATREIVLKMRLADATSQEAATAACTLAWLRDLDHLVRNPDVPDLGCLQTWVRIPAELWAIAETGEPTDDDFATAVIPVIARLMTYEPRLLTGADLNPAAVRAELLDQSDEDEGERPAWFLLGWAMAHGHLAGWWDRIVAMAAGTGQFRDEAAFQGLMCGPGDDDQTFGAG